MMSIRVEDIEVASGGGDDLVYARRLQKVCKCLVQASFGYNIMLILYMACL